MTKTIESTEDFTKNMKEYNSRIKNLIGQEKKPRWKLITGGMISLALISAIGGPFIGEGFTSRVKKFIDSDVKWTFNDLSLVLIQGKIIEYTGGEELIIKIPQIYGGKKFDTTSPIDPNTEKEAIEDIIKGIKELKRKSVTVYFPIPGFDGYINEKSQPKIVLQKIQGNASSENFGKQKINDRNDSQNKELAYKRALKFNDALISEIKSKLSKEGIDFDTQSYSIEGNIEMFLSSELSDLYDIAIRNNINENDLYKTILKLLYKYENGNIDKNSKDYTIIKEILESKRTVKIAIKVNDGYNITTFNFLVLPWLGLYLLLGGFLITNQNNKYNEKYNQIFKYMIEGKDDEWIKANINLQV